MGNILKFDDFIKKHKNDETSSNELSGLDFKSLEKPKLAKKVEEEEEKELPKLEEGDYVKDRYGNTYEVVKTTKSFKEADEIDDWDQISKFKDNPDVTFVIVWAKSTKQKKLVFVYGVEDDMYSVKKTDKKDKEDFFTQTFRKGCAEVDEERLEKFKKRWRKFIDMVRDGEIASKKEEKLILNQILSDFNILSIIKKQEKKKDKILDKDEQVKESRVWEDEDEKGAGKKVADSPVETPGPEPKKVEKAEKKADDANISDDSEFNADAAKEPDEKDEPSEEDLEREKELNDRESDLEKREERLKRKEKYETDKKRSDSKESKEKHSDGKDNFSGKKGGHSDTKTSPKSDSAQKSSAQKTSGATSDSGTSGKDSGSGKTGADSKPDKDSGRSKGDGGKEGDGGKDDSNSEDKKQAKKTVFIGKKEKVTLGPRGTYGSYEVSYGNKLYYIMPEDEEKETQAYIDEQCKTKAVGERHILKFNIKDLFGIEKYMKYVTTAAEPGMWNSEKDAKERAEKNIEKMKEDKKKDKKKDKKDEE